MTYVNMACIEPPVNGLDVGLCCRKMRKLLVFVFATDRLLQRSVFRLRPAAERHGPRHPPRRRHRHPREEVDSSTSCRLLPRAFIDWRADGADRDRSLHRVAWAGARLQSRPARDPAAARESGEGARAEVRPQRVSRCG